MKKKSLLLIDFNNLLYRSVFAHQGLSHRGKFTGGMFGFMDMVASTVNRYNCDRVVVCRDNKPYLRTKFYPAYKADREKKSSIDEEGLKQVAISNKQIIKFLSRFRFPIANVVGNEADDLIGEFCSFSKAFKNIIVMSNDSDLYQLLDGRVFLAKAGGLYGLNDFNRDWPDIVPAQWSRCVALKGSHNGVEGIRGVGDKTAYKVVAEGITDAQIWTRWRVRRKDLAVQTALATFPFPLVPRPDLPRVLPIKYDAGKFSKECDRHGIRFKDEFHEAFMRLSK